MTCIRLAVVFAMAFSGTLYAADCAIVQVMKKQQERANSRSQAIIENLVQQPNLQKNACLPITEKLGGMISSSLPSLQAATLKGIAEAVKKAACASINSAIETGSEQLQVGWEAPYGMGGVSAGTTTNGQTGYQHTDGANIDLTKGVTDVFTDGIDTGVDGALSGFKDDVSGNIGINHKDARAIEQEWQEIRDSLYE